MNMNQFFRDLTSTVAGGAERRSARDLARELGFRVHEPEHSTTRTRDAQPVTTPPPAAEPEAEHSSPSFESGVEHGKSWGFNRAYLSDLERLIEWATAVRGEFTGIEVAAAVFPNPVGEWKKHDAERLLGGDVDYGRGFVVGAMLVWAEQFTKYQKEAKEN
jgi:hypothetical protein